MQSEMLRPTCQELSSLLKCLGGPSHLKTIAPLAGGGWCRKPCVHKQEPSPRRCHWTGLTSHCSTSETPLAIFGPTCLYRGWLGLCQACGTLRSLLVGSSEMGLLFNRVLSRAAEEDFFVKQVTDGAANETWADDDDELLGG